jgi:vesicle coat complex subunit
LNCLATDPANKEALKAKGAVDALKLLVRSKDPDVKAEAIEALAKLGIHAKVCSSSSSSSKPIMLVLYGIFDHYLLSP